MAAAENGRWEGPAPVMRGAGVIRVTFDRVHPARQARDRRPRFAGETWGVTAGAFRAHPGGRVPVLEPLPIERDTL